MTVRPLLGWLVLRRARRLMPEMFDGAAAVASVEACLRADGY